MSGHAPLPRVLVAGGGVAALETVLALRELIPNLLHIDVLTASPDFVYRPVSVAEPFARGEARRFSWELIGNDRSVTVHHGELALVDPLRAARQHSRQSGASLRPSRRGNRSTRGQSTPWRLGLSRRRGRGRDAGFALRVGARGRDARRLHDALIDDLAASSLRVDTPDRLTPARAQGPRSRARTRDPGGGPARPVRSGGR